MNKSDSHQEFLLESEAASDTSPTRREFLGTLATGFGVAGLSTARPAAATSAQLPGQPQGVRIRAGLTAADFRYRGCFALPDSPDWANGKQTGTSFGTITLRRVGGSLRLFTTGRDVWGTNPAGEWVYPPDQVYEVEVPGNLSPDAATAMSSNNRASLVRWWGDVYQGKRLYQNQPSGNPSYLGGLLWDEARGGLWIAYKDTYGINANDPCLLFSRLNADGTAQTFGPWRPTCGSHRGGGYLSFLPSEFANRPDLASTPIAGKRLVLSAMYGSGGAASPWGINAQVVLQEPTSSTPADPNVTGGRASVPVHALAQFDMTHLQPAPPGLRRVVCESLQLYNPGRQVNPSAPFQTALPVLGPVGAISGVGGNVVNDYITSAVWVNTDSGKQAVIFAGQFVDGETEDAHAWYGENRCIHGKHDPWHEATGPGATHRKLALMIYDQNDFARVARGEMSPYSLRETGFIRLSSLVPEMASAASSTGTLRLAFDRATNQLFIAEAKRDWSNVYAGKAIIRVFQL